MCQTNRFLSVPKNLICCHSPVIKWSSFLAHRRSSNTLGLRGFQSWDCWQDSRWLHGNHKPILTFFGFISPVGPYFQLKEAQSRAKAKPDTCKSSQRRICPWERGSSHMQGLLRGRGEELGWALTETWHADLQPEDQPNFCLKLMNK